MERVIYAVFVYENDRENNSVSPGSVVHKIQANVEIVGSVSYPVLHQI